MLLVMASKLVRVRWKEGKTYILNVGGYLTYRSRFQVPEKDWRKSKFLPNCRKDETEGNKLKSTEIEENKSTYEVTSNRKPPPLPELWSVTKWFDQWRQYPNRLLTCIIKLDLVGSGRWLRPSQTYIGNHEQKVALISYEKAAKGQDIS